MLGTPKDGTLERKVTIDEAEAYDPLYHEFPCTADSFRLHLDSTPAHPWNKAAVNVFVTSFCDKYPDYTADDVASHFKVHIETLIRKYRVQQRLKGNLEAKRAELKKNRKNTRKVTVSSFLSMKESTTPGLSNRTQLLEDRRKTARSVPELGRHVWILDSLGYAGMSSDESSTEHGVKLYRIKKKFWRAAELGPFLHAIDRVTAQTKNVTTARGSTKYHRLPGENTSSEGGVVPRLPINFYDAAWLANLQTHMKPAYESLGINPIAYPLIHDQVIQE